MALVDDYAEAVWTAVSRTLDTGVVPDPETTQEFYADEVWTAVSRTLTGGAAPDAPTDLALVSQTATTVNLSWTDNADDEDGFDLQYDVVNTFDEDPQTIEITSETETATVLDLIENETYYFRVRATNAGGDSDWSNTLEVFMDGTAPTLSAPTVPSDGTTLTATLSESGCTPASGSGGFLLAGTDATVATWAISGTTLTLTLLGTVYDGETVTYSYDRADTTDDIADAAGNFLANFSAAAVTNDSTQEDEGGGTPISADVRRRRRVAAYRLHRALVRRGRR